MKSGAIFFLGIVAGSILTLGVLELIGGGYLGSLYEFGLKFENESENELETEPTTAGVATMRTDSKSFNSDFTIAEKPVEFTESKSFKVSKVLENGALARCKSKDLYYGSTVYIPASGQNLFYEEQIIEPPKGKKVVQIGVYRYKQYEFSDEKVVPVLEFQ